MFRRGLSKLDSELEVSDAALEIVCEERFGPVYGELPLMRAIERSTDNRFLKELASGEFAPESTIRTVAKGSEFVFA